MRTHLSLLCAPQGPTRFIYMRDAPSLFVLAGEHLVSYQTLERRLRVATK